MKTIFFVIISFSEVSIPATRCINNCSFATVIHTTAYDLINCPRSEPFAASPCCGLRRFCAHIISDAHQLAHMLAGREWGPSGGLTRRPGNRSTSNGRQPITLTTSPCCFLRTPNCIAFTTALGRVSFLVTA